VGKIKLKATANVKRPYTMTEEHRLQLAEANRKRGSRPVVDIATGRRFASVTEAAEAIGASISALIHSIRRQGSCRGRRFRYESDPPESTDSEPTNSELRAQFPV
jgi:hypothetical protein